MRVQPCNEQGVTIFNISFPIDCILRNSGAADWAAVDAKDDLCEIFVFCDLRMFLDAEIVGIPVHYLVIFP